MLRTAQHRTTTAILNAYFVAIKVDREERPDVDGVKSKN
jgi:uncharacterized protein YyaL (SSP411 family)